MTTIADLPQHFIDDLFGYQPIAKVISGPRKEHPALTNVYGFFEQMIVELIKLNEPKKHVRFLNGENEYRITVIIADSTRRATQTDILRKRPGAAAKTVKLLSSSKSRKLNLSHDGTTFTVVNEAIIQQDRNDFRDTIDIIMGDLKTLKIDIHDINNLGQEVRFSLGNLKNILGISNTRHIKINDMHMFFPSQIDVDAYYVIMGKGNGLHKTIVFLKNEVGENTYHSNKNEGHVLKFNNGNISITLKESNESNVPLSTPYTIEAKYTPDIFTVHFIGTYIYNVKHEFIKNSERAGI